MPPNMSYRLVSRPHYNDGNIALDVNFLYSAMLINILYPKPNFWPHPLQASTRPGFTGFACSSCMVNFWGYNIWTRFKKKLTHFHFVMLSLTGFLLFF